MSESNLEIKPKNLEEAIAINATAFSRFSFIDLFAGVGGFHYALKSFGANCVFASEIDKHASLTYEENHGLKPSGDITKISEADIPKHDILCGGFPCQAFSISGKQKGFEDTRGTLFFDVARIVKYHQPKIVFLENVKNLVKHNKGNTLATIRQTLEELNYTVFYQVLNTSDFGLPQNRERIYFVAFHKGFIRNPQFIFPNPQLKSKLSDILEDETSQGKVIERNDISFYKTFVQEANLFGEEEIINKPFQIGFVNKGGQGERIYDINGHAITLSAHGGGIGAKTGLYKVGNKIRKLSPRECARLQGFPEDFKPHKSTAQALKQMGNSVSVTVLKYILNEIFKTISDEKRTSAWVSDSKRGVQEREGYRPQI